MDSLHNTILFNQFINFVTKKVNKEDQQMLMTIYWRLLNVALASNINDVIGIESVFNSLPNTHQVSIANEIEPRLPSYKNSHLRFIPWIVMILSNIKYTEYARWCQTNKTNFIIYSDTEHVLFNLYSHNRRVKNTIRMNGKVVRNKLKYIIGSVKGVKKMMYCRSYVSRSYTIYKLSQPSPPLDLRIFKE